MPASLLMFAACSYPRTQIMFEISADAEVLQNATAFRVELYARNAERSAAAERVAQWSRTAVASTPMFYSVVASKDRLDAEYFARISAIRESGASETSLAVARVISVFARGRVLRVPVHLYANCECTNEGETCAATNGRNCVDAEQPLSTLRDYTAPSSSVDGSVGDSQVPRDGTINDTAPRDSQTGDGNVSVSYAVEAFVKATNPSAGDHFSAPLERSGLDRGANIALSAAGDVLVVGSAGEDGSTTTINGQPDDLADNRGAVYVYRRNNSTWTFEAYLKPSFSGSNLSFGETVAISADGTRIAVGVPSYSTPNGSGGVAVAFRRENDMWQQDGILNPSAVSMSYCGDTLAISSDGLTVALGCPFTNQVHVFRRGATNWTNTGAILDSYTNTNFGQGLALNSSGTRLYVGAPLDRGLPGNRADRGTTSSGSVLVYDFSNGSWTQSRYMKSSQASPSGQFGKCIQLSDDDSTFVASNNNTIEIYINDSYVRSLTAPAGALPANFSEVFALSRNGSTLLAASTRNEEGLAYAFDVSSGNLLATLEPLVFDRGDDYGVTLALDATGARAAIGMPGESSNSIGPQQPATAEALANNSASSSGAVYIHRR